MSGFRLRPCLGPDGGCPLGNQSETDLCAECERRESGATQVVPMPTGESEGKAAEESGEGVSSGGRTSESQASRLVELAQTTGAEE